MIRWALFAGLWFWAITSENFWLGIIAFVVLLWPTPEQRFNMVHNKWAIARANRKYNKWASQDNDNWFAE